MPFAKGTITVLRSLGGPAARLGHTQVMCRCKLRPPGAISHAQLPPQALTHPLCVRNSPPLRRPRPTTRLMCGLGLQMRAGNCWRLPLTVEKQ